MGRPAIGCAQWRGGKWLAILSVGTKRVPVEMPEVPPHPEGCMCTVKAPCEARVEATRFAAVVAKRARDRGALLPGEEGGETCGEYFERWVAARKEHGIRTTRHDWGRWRKWLAKHLAAKCIKAVTTRDLEILVSVIDKDVRAGKLAWRTSLHVWGLVTKMFDDACRSKALALRVRSDNPAANVRGPDRGHDKAGAFLFPSDLLRLAACELVPQWRRRLYVFASYTGLRAGEIRALEWPDVHEEQGFILVHRASDYDTGEAKGTKTGRSRKVPIEPTLLPVLAAMREELEGEGLVFARLPHKSEFPWLLREDLKAAGVARAELHNDTETSRKLDFHDLRHGYGTWRAIRGDDVVKIRFAMGHTDLATTQRYINEAQTFELGFGDPFGPLPRGLIARPEYRANIVAGTMQVPVTVASPGGVEPPLAT